MPERGLCPPGAALRANARLTPAILVDMDWFLFEKHHFFTRGSGPLVFGALVSGIRHSCEAKILWGLGHLLQTHSHDRRVGIALAPLSSRVGEKGSRKENRSPIFEMHSGVPTTPNCFVCSQEGV